MPAKKMKLTKAQQKALMEAMSATQKQMIVDAMMRHHAQTGTGFLDSVKSFFKKAGQVLSPALPFLKDISGPILKEVLLPIIKSKIGATGSGMSLAGSGLKLAGQGKPRGRPRGRPKKTLTLK